MLDYLGNAAIQQISPPECEVAKNVLGKGDLQPEDRAVGVVCTRVRQSLVRYYAAEGKHDPLTISLTGLTVKAERRESIRLAVRV
jgi:hypothetical protein